MLEIRRALQAQAIKTREGDAKLAQISRVLPQTLLDHADELLSVFITFHEEHVPLVRALAPVVGRCNGIIAAQRQAFAAQQAAQEPQKTEVGNETLEQSNRGDR